MDCFDFEGFTVCTGCAEPLAVADVVDTVGIKDAVWVESGLGLVDFDWSEGFEVLDSADMVVVPVR